MLAKYSTNNNPDILAQESKYKINWQNVYCLNYAIQFPFFLQLEKDLTGLGLVAGLFEFSDPTQQLPSFGQKASESNSSQNNANNPLTHSPSHGRGLI